MYEKTLMRFGDRGIMIETKQGNKAKHTPGQPAGLPRLEAGSSMCGVKAKRRQSCFDVVKKACRFAMLDRLKLYKGTFLCAEDVEVQFSCPFWVSLFEWVYADVEYRVLREGSDVCGMIYQPLVW